MFTCHWRTSLCAICNSASRSAKLVSPLVDLSLFCSYTCSCILTSSSLCCCLQHATVCPATSIMQMSLLQSQLYTLCYQNQRTCIFFFHWDPQTHLLSLYPRLTCSFLCAPPVLSGQLLRDICVAGDQSDVLPLASTLTINSAMNAPSVPLTDAGMVRKIMTFVGLLQSNGPLAADGSAQIPRLETIVVTEVPSLFKYWGKIFHNIMGSLAAHLGWAYKCCQSGDFESFFCAAPLAYVNLCSFAAISTFTTAQFERIPIESAWSLPFGELGLLALTDTGQGSPTRMINMNPSFFV